MLKKITLLFSFLGILFTANANPNADEILGTWLNASGLGRIQIYKEGNAYFGKIIWLKEPNNANGGPKLDINNPDPQLKTKPLIGAIVLRKFVYDDGEWNGGRIYDPQNGKDYKCYLKLKDANTLSLRGYIGISLLGRTEIWKRIP